MDKKKSISAAAECEALWKSVNQPTCTYTVISTMKRFGPDQIDMRNLSQIEVDLSVRVSLEADWTYWTSSSMLLCRELVPSSTWCFVFTLNSFRLCSWLPSLTQISPVEKREVNWCLPSSQVHPSPTYTLLFSSLLLHSPAIRCPLKQLSR